MKITLPVELLDDVAYSADLEPDDVRTEYSGRAMYGASCVGVVGSPGSGMRFAFELLDKIRETNSEENGLDLDELKDVLSDVRTDSMGLDMITYWPKLQANG